MGEKATAAIAATFPPNGQGSRRKEEKEGEGGQERRVAKKHRFHSRAPAQGFARDQSPLHLDQADLHTTRKVCLLTNPPLMSTYPPLADPWLA